MSAAASIKITAPVLAQVMTVRLPVLPGEPDDKRPMGISCALLR